MPTESPAEKLARALDATGALVTGVQRDQWTNSTPCPDWTVRELLNHLVSGNRAFAASVRADELIPPETLQRIRSGDYLGDDPVKGYRDAADDLVAAMSRPDLFEHVYRVPVGTVPGAMVLHLRLTEVLVHGWDLAQATGQPASLPDDLAEEALAFSSSSNAPQVPRGGHPFGPITAIGDDAPAIDRLAAYLGRSPRAEKEHV